MKTFATVYALVGLVGLASAHMEMMDPPPFKSKYNDLSGTDVDYAMTNPLDKSGSDYPCKGHHELMDSPQGGSVADWAPGQTYSMTITGGANHAGGSCQASLSFDQGASFTAIHTYYGNCPAAGESNLEFTLPNDTPAGSAIFAWTWFNNVGNREMYMNCAHVTIGGGAAKRDRLAARSPEDSFSSRPAMFVANVANGCDTLPNTDVEFPNPGPDVTNNGASLTPPTGSGCGGGGGGGGGDNAAPAPPAPSDKPEDPAPAPQDPAPPAAPSSAVPAVPSAAPPQPSSPSETVVEGPGSQPTSVPGGVFVTVPGNGTPSTLSTSVRPAPTGSVEGAMTAGEACETEGEWNCVGGSQFQRCASGAWSVLQPLNPGVGCQAGRSNDFAMNSIEN